MANLLFKTAGFANRVIELKPGVNRFGRSPANDFEIEHPTVSAFHCEIMLNDKELVVRDCLSTNGTFVDGRPVQERMLRPGQTLHLGEIELFVETSEARIAIPRFEIPRLAPPVVLFDGSLLCPHHPQERVNHRCTHCREMLCDACVTRLRRRGGELLMLCPLCSYKVEPLGVEKKKKKSFLSFLQQTGKVPFRRTTRRIKAGR